MYNALIFDFYDVLYTDSYKAWLTKNGLDRAGPYRHASELLDKGKIEWDEFIALIADASGQTAAEVTSNFRTMNTLDYKLVDLLKSLHKNYPLGLVSNGNSTQLRALFQQYDLSSLFAEVIISSEVGLIKPDPAIFRLMIEKLGTPAEQTIFVDDNEQNIKAAQSMHMHGIWYQNLISLKRELHHLGINVPV